MPNWKNAADYEFGDDSENARWCWEFMRRNVQYRSDYQEVAEILAKIPEGRRVPKAPKPAEGKILAGPWTWCHKCGEDFPKPRPTFDPGDLCPVCGGTADPWAATDAGRDNHNRAEWEAQKHARFEYPEETPCNAKS